MSVVDIRYQQIEEEDQADSDIHHSGHRTVLHTQQSTPISDLSRKRSANPQMADDGMNVDTADEDLELSLALALSLAEVF